MTGTTLHHQISDSGLVADKLSLFGNVSQARGGMNKYGSEES